MRTSRLPWAIWRATPAIDCSERPIIWVVRVDSSTATTSASSEPPSSSQRRRETASSTSVSGRAARTTKVVPPAVLVRRARYSMSRFDGGADAAVLEPLALRQGRRHLLPAGVVVDPGQLGQGDARVAQHPAVLGR